MTIELMAAFARMLLGFVLVFRGLVEGDSVAIGIAMLLFYSNNWRDEQ